MATPIKFGTEFLVNTTTANGQDLAAIAALADGRFVIAWADVSQTGGDTSSFAVRAQVFNADGTPSGTEFLVNTTTINSQDVPAITALADGRFVITWQDSSQTGGDTSLSAIRAQVFNADGTPSGTEFLANTTTTSIQEFSAITALADGRFVITWQDFSQTGGDISSSAVRAQVFNADGTPSGTEFLVNTTTTSNQDVPAIAALADGRFVITWQDFSQTGGDISSSAVRAQVFNADGTPSGTEFLVNTTTTSNQDVPAIAALADGRFVITWQDFSQTGGDISSSAVRAQVFNADGTPSGTEFLVNTTITIGQEIPAITALADGRFVITWQDFSQTGGDTSGLAVRAQVFNADGTPSGAEFLVNTTTTDSQQSSAITALADGRFVVTWQDFSLTGGDTSSSAIRAQVFNPDGTSSGTEFLVNTTTTANQANPAITALADGRFVVTWEDFSQTGGDISSSAVRAQVFDPRTTGLSWRGTIVADQFVGTFLNDTLNGFLGDDTLSGGNGQDVIDGDRGNDSLAGNGGNDLLRGGEDNDSLQGGQGFDELYGGNGNDVLNGGSGLDYLEGGSGNDIYVVDSLNDAVVEAGAGTDEVRSGQISLNLNNYANVENLRLLGSNALNAVGNDQSNRLVGNSGNNNLQGLDGNDNLSGDSGSDTLVGGIGSDSLTGEAGNDIFDYNAIAESTVSGTGRDRILDFVQGQDKIDLSGIDAIAGGIDDAFTFVGTAAFSGAGQLRYQASGTNTLIQADINGGGADFAILVTGSVAFAFTDFQL